MNQEHSTIYVQRAPSSGGVVSGWLVGILLILVAALYLQLNGLWPQPLLNPNAAARAVTPRGDLAEDEKSTIAIFRSASQSVVHITTSVLGRTRFRMDPVNIPLGSGSGFIWDNKGYVVTNYHVIQGAQQNGGDIRVVLYNSTTYPAQVVGVNRDADLAVVKINAPAADLKPISVGTSHDLQVGQKVFAIGSPFSLDQSLTTGIVSGLGREIESESGHTSKDMIQVSAAINPGNSGGPLLDSAGRLIGVNAAILSGTGEFSGIGFAIPVDTVNAVVPELIQSGTAEPAALGVTLLRDDKTEQLRASGVIKRQGVLIYDVTPGSAAKAAGLDSASVDADGQLHADLIVAIDGKPVTDAKSLSEIVRSKKVGDVITLTIVRAGRELQMPVKLQPRPGVD